MGFSPSAQASLLILPKYVAPAYIIALRGSLKIRIHIPSPSTLAEKGAFVKVRSWKTEPLAAPAYLRRRSSRRSILRWSHGLGSACQCGSAVVRGLLDLESGEGIGWGICEWLGLVFWGLLYRSGGGVRRWIGSCVGRCRGRSCFGLYLIFLLAVPNAPSSSPSSSPSHLPYNPIYLKT